jgi:hypothetical protein
MRKAGSFALLMAAAVLLAACGGSDGTLLAPPVPGAGGGDDGDTAPPPVLSALTLVTGSNLLQSDGATPVEITARVVDADNVAVSDVPVNFSADSGVLAVTQRTTDDAGRATARLSTEGNPANRIITVSASALSADGETVGSSATVTVTGTALNISGPGALVLGATGVYTLELTDGSGDGIADVSVAVASALGNAIDPATVVTDEVGRAEVTLTATIGGAESITASAIGAEAEPLAVAISSDNFAFITPAPPTDPGAVPPEVDLGAVQPIEVRWERNGTAVDGQPVDFTTTRGQVAQGTVVTSGGVAGTTISSLNAGRATITASNSPDGPSTSITVEFVATTPDTIEVQADPFNVGPNQQSTITAIVRDPAGNLVKNQTVEFELDDVTGGSLSVGAAVTDSSGRARTFYRASSTTSASEGVIITARVKDTALADAVALTVARREVFFTFGTGNTILEPDPATYSLPFLVQATDAEGVGVPGVSVELSILTDRYVKGYWVGDTIAQRWFAITNTAGGCPDEDVNRNGRLDPGEDVNGNGVIDVGNNATIVPGVATTDETGSALFNIEYAQQFGNWLQVIVEARTEVEGTEFSESQSFLLPVLASDVNNINVSPPGNGVPADRANGYPNSDEQLVSPFVLGPVSPFGYSTSCFNDI